MSEPRLFDTFKVGDKVAHITLGDGIVREIGSEVCVFYGERGPTGKYDHRWFELHPNFLFHRSSRKPRP